MCPQVQGRQGTVEQLPPGRSSRAQESLGGCSSSSQILRCSAKAKGSARCQRVTAPGSLCWPRSSLFTCSGCFQLISSSTRSTWGREHSALRPGSCSGLALSAALGLQAGKPQQIPRDLGITEPQESRQIPGITANPIASAGNPPTRQPPRC